MQTAGLPTVPDDSLFVGSGYMKRIRMTDVREVVQGEDSDVVMAIPEANISWRHPDIAGNIWTNPGEVAGSGVDDDERRRCARLEFCKQCPGPYRT